MRNKSVLEVIDASAGYGPEDRAQLLKRGMGITNLVPRATARADELDAASPAAAYGADARAAGIPRSCARRLSSPPPAAPALAMRAATAPPDGVTASPMSLPAGVPARPGTDWADNCPRWVTGRAVTT